MSDQHPRATAATVDPRPRIADVLLLPQMSRAAVFTTGDVATFADVSTSSANRALAMLAARGLITPVVRGI